MILLTENDVQIAILDDHQNVIKDLQCMGLLAEQSLMVEKKINGLQ